MKCAPAQDHDIKIKVLPTLEDAAASVKSGEPGWPKGRRFHSLAYDSTTPASSVGLPMLAAPPVYVAPCVRGGGGCKGGLQVCCWCWLPLA